MTVSELIEALKALPGELPVLCDKACENGWYDVNLVEKPKHSGNADRVWIGNVEEWEKNADG